MAAAPCAEASARSSKVDASLVVPDPKATLEARRDRALGQVELALLPADARGAHQWIIRFPSVSDDRAPRRRRFSPDSTHRLPAVSRLEVQIEETPFANDWDLWVFPPDRKTDSGGTSRFATRSTPHARNFMRGRRCYWTLTNWVRKTMRSLRGSSRSIGRRGCSEADMRRCARCVRHRSSGAGEFSNRGSITTGDGRSCAAMPAAFRLDGLPLEYQPMQSQPICDFHFNWKLGAVFELRSREGGSLLVCGYDITNDLSNRPAARQLRESLLAYIEFSIASRRATEADDALLSRIIPVVEGRAGGDAPAGSSKRHSSSRRCANIWPAAMLPGSPELDDAKIAAAGFGYQVSRMPCGVARRVRGRMVGASRERPHRSENSQTEATTTFMCIFTTGTTTAATGTSVFWGVNTNSALTTAPANGIKLEVRPEDCLDGKIVLEAETTAGPRSDDHEIGACCHGNPKLHRW